MLGLKEFLLFAMTIFNFQIRVLNIVRFWITIVNSIKITSYSHKPPKDQPKLLDFLTTNSATEFADLLTKQNKISSEDARDLIFAKILMTSQGEVELSNLHQLIIEAHSHLIMTLTISTFPHKIIASRTANGSSIRTE